MLENIYDHYQEKTVGSSDEVIMIHGNCRISRKEFNDKINLISQSILSLNIQPGHHIGIMLKPGMDRISALFAILKTGNVFLFIQPSDNEKEINELIKQANISCIIASSTSIASISKDLLTININNISETGHSTLDKENCLKRRKDNRDTAYLMHTSGSTGIRKITLGTHSGTINRLKWGWRVFPYESDDVCCHKTSTSFVDVIAEILSPILCGTLLVIVDDHQKNDIKELSKIINQHRVTHLTLVPSILRLILNDHTTIRENYHSVRTWFCSGEELHYDLVTSFKITFNSSRLINIYGSTEVSADCCYFDFTDEISSNRIPIGRPIDNMNIEILRDDNSQTKINEIGHIAVSGVGVSQGYHNNPTLNNKKFIIINNTRFYKTDDLGYKDDHGLIHYCGRNDDTVIAGGEKFYLNDLTRKIHSILGLQLRNVVLIKSSDQSSNIDVFIFVECDPENSNSNRDKIIEFISKEYANKFSFKLFTLVDIPLNTSLKVDGKALIIYASNHADTISTATRKTKNSGLKALWCSMLNIEEVNDNDNFFALGGNSLKGMHLISQIRSQLEINLNLGTLFKHPCFHEFEYQLNKSPKFKAIDKSDSSTAEFAQLTAGQQHILLSSLVSENHFLFNIVLHITLQGNLSLEYLSQSLNQLWDLNPELKTVFESVNGSFIQKRVTGSSFPLESIDKTNFRDENTICNKLLEEAKHYRFNIEKGPLVKSFLYQENQDHTHLILVFHHTIIDDISLDIFLRNLSDLYNNKQNEHKGQEKTGNSLDQISFLEQEYLQMREYKRSLNYWASKLHQIEKVPLPIDYPRRALARNLGNTLNIVLPSTISSHVFSFSKEHNTTPFIVLGTVFCLLLSSYSLSNTVPISMPITTRGRFDDQEIIGCFTNFITLVVSIISNQSFLENLSQFQEILFEGLEHRFVPFSHVLTELKQIRSISLSPLSNVMIISQSNHSEDFKIAGLTTVVNEENVNGSNTDLSLIIREGDNNIAIGFEYDTDLFAHPTIEKIAQQYLQILESALKSPTQCIIPNAFTKLETLDSNLIKIDTSVKEEFENRVSQHPNSIAVVHNNQHLTYLELNQISNQIGHFLISKGLLSNDLVGIYSCRSIRMLVFMLGVLKAGGCFLLLDHNLPESLILKQIHSLNLKYLVASSEDEHITEEFLKDNNIGRILLELEVFTDYPTHNLCTKVNPSNHCYYIQTSGTTGTPKVAMNHHRGALYHIQQSSKKLNLDSSFCILQTASVQSDVVVWQYLGPLTCRG